MSFGLFFQALRTIGASRDFTGDLTPDASGVIGTDELPAVALPLPAGEDIRARWVRDPARLDGYFVSGCVRGRGSTTDFASVHPFSRGWHKVWPGG